MFNNKIRIGNKIIGFEYPVYFIADIAANHDGILERAKNLIYLAKESGADCVKFQHFLPDKIVSDFGFKNLKGCLSHQSSWKKSVYEIYDDYHCKREWTKDLVQTCREVNIEFMTTPYDYSAIKNVNDWVNAYKIGSGDITRTKFVEYVSKLGKPVLLATGASSIDDVDRAVGVIKKNTSDLILMQCNTNYTASLENIKYINLNVLRTFSCRYPGAILGLSDHTFGHTTVLGAVALGARVIEKHFTDDNERVGPDHQFAMNPKSLKEMVNRTRELEYALGDGMKKIEKNEVDTVVIQRRSLYLKRDMKIGEKLTFDDIDELRPAPSNAYFPYEIEKCLDKTLLVDKFAGDCLYKGDLDE